MPQEAALERFRRLLLIQCRPEEATRWRFLAKQQDTGMVLTGEWALHTAEWLSDNGFRGPLLCDRDRYSGKLRRSALGGLDSEWTRRQLELFGVALTDSGYLEAADWRGLRLVLDHASAYTQPVIALLPLQTRWFERETDIDWLVELIIAADVPVAVVLEHSDDPFGVRYVLRGLLRLLDQLASLRIPLLLLRSDHSTLGALSHGAFAAAIGTHPALRHLYPRNSFGRKSSDTAVFVPSLLAYHGMCRVRELTEALPDLGGRPWECECTECHGAQLAELEGTRALARHSLAAQLDKSAELLRLAHPAQPPRAWRAACSHALFLYQQLAEWRTGWQCPQPPQALRHWAATPLESSDLPFPWLLDQAEPAFATYRADRQQSRRWE